MADVSRKQPRNKRIILMINKIRILLSRTDRTLADMSCTIPVEVINHWKGDEAATTIKI